MARPVASRMVRGRSITNSGVGKSVPRSQNIGYRAATRTLLAVALLLGACAGPRQQVVGPAPKTTTGLTAHIIASDTPLECVPYARKLTNVSIQGDAWTWWQSAGGRFRRDGKPAVGSILVLKRTSRLRSGHLAVVSRVLSRREILVEHANWLNRRQIHKNTPVRDVSSKNDWSAVRVWYTPGNTLGKRTYLAYGFIHPHNAPTLQLRQPRMQGAEVRALQEMLVDKGFDVVIDGIFGPETRDALDAYQERYGLSKDGIAGPETRASLGV